MGIKIDEMDELVICKHCNKPEYNGEIIWLNGSRYCRKCYSNKYTSLYGKTCNINTDRDIPTQDAYDHQEYMKEREDNMVDLFCDYYSIDDVDKLFLRDSHLDVSRFLHIEDGNLRMEVLI